MVSVLVVIGVEKKRKSDIYSLVVHNHQPEEGANTDHILK